MKKTLGKLLILALVLASLLSLAACAKKPDDPLTRTASYLQSQVKEPSFGALGGDWLVFGLSRSGADEMASEQALYALAAVHRAQAGLSTLYDMTDVMQ